MNHRSLKEQYKQINLIFVILYLGIFILSGTSVFIKLTSSYKLLNSGSDIYTFFKILLGCFIIILLPLGYYLHRRKVTRLSKTVDLSLKLARYKASLVIKLLLIEFLCLFNLAVFLLFGDYYLLIPVSFLLLIMLINRPAIENISNELNLTAEEKERILGL